MKRETALKALDDEAGQEIGLLLRIFKANLLARNSKAEDEFSDGISLLVKAYDGASKIITDKLVE